MSVVSTGRLVRAVNMVTIQIAPFTKRPAGSLTCGETLAKLSTDFGGSINMRQVGNSLTNHKTFTRSSSQLIVLARIYSSFTYLPAMEAILSLPFNPTLRA